MFIAVGSTFGLRAGPPFLTDDPDPVELNHWEFYTFGIGDRTPDYDLVWGPAFEFNYGLAPDTQFHLIAPVADFSSPGTGWASGYGDTEIGIKYRFVHETDWRPEIAIFPFVELPTGNGARGLGNGKTWYELPVWAQKSLGPWTIDGGGGVGLNSAAGQRSFGYGGLLLQRDLGRYLTLGAEIFQEGAETTDGRASTIANAGGYLKFTDSFNLLLSAGHSVAGERQTVWYLALYWTGGPKEPEKKLPSQDR
jgi:hypothetical protein